VGKTISDLPPIRDNPLEKERSTKAERNPSGSGQEIPPLVNAACGGHL